jgi:hypothetical protein
VAGAPNGAAANKREELAMADLHPEELTTRVWFEFSRICVGSWFNFARNRRRITIDSLLLLWVLHVWWARSIDTVSNEDGDLAPDDYTRRRK